MLVAAIVVAIGGGHGLPSVGQETRLPAPWAATEVDATTAPSGERVMTLIPANFDPAKGAPLVIYHHGVGEDEKGLLKDRLKTECVQALLRAGYVLCGSNAGGNNWGCQKALDAYAELYKYAVSHWRITRTCFWSQSMGGVSGLLELRDKRIPNVQGWMGTYPVTNLQELYKFGRFTTQIQASYGFDSETKYAAATAGHDPLTLKGKSFRTPRIRIYASPDDTVVTKSGNADPMAVLLSRGRSECDVVVCRGDHGDPSHFVPKDYVAFFDRCVPTVRR